MPIIIGLGHFKQGHYGRAIESLEKVGTVMSTNHIGQAKLEIGKRLFIKVEDADLAVLDGDETVRDVCKTTASRNGECLPLGRNVESVGIRPTRLGKPQLNNGILRFPAGMKSTSNTVTNTRPTANSINRLS